MCKMKENKYNNLTIIEPIIVADGFVTFSPNFEYLRLLISFNLCDDYDIHKRIPAANASMGTLSEMWKDDHVDI